MNTSGIHAARSIQISADYYDDDIIIIDNIKKFAEHDSAKMEMNLIALVSSGKARMNINGKETHLEARQLLVCPPNTTFSDMLFSTDFEFKVMLLTNRILYSFLRDKIKVWNDLMYIYKVYTFPYQDGYAGFFSHFYNILRLCVETPNETPYRNDIIHSILQAGLLGLTANFLSLRDESRQGDATIHGGHPDTTRGSILFQRFLNQLNNSRQKFRSVESFAAGLCISPKYLTAVCKKQSDKTAHEWIRDYVLEDIRYHLRHTDLPIKEISDRIGFPNTSFFGRYVKEHFGVTPMQLRQS